MQYGATQGKLRYDPISLTAPAGPRQRAWRCYGNTAACLASAISDENLGIAVGVGVKLFDLVVKQTIEYEGSIAIGALNR
jgi:hypothetical protein